MALLTHTCTDTRCYYNDDRNPDAECEEECSYYPVGRRLDLYSVASLEYVKTVDIPVAINGKGYQDIGPAFVNGNKFSLAVNEHDSGQSLYVEVSF